jgi:hypothetical protein
MAQHKLKIIVNDVEFAETPFPKFATYGEKDLFPFIDSVYSEEGSSIQPMHRVYKSLAFNGKFFAPKIK